jgi:hypothetical protein
MFYLYLRYLAFFTLVVLQSGCMLWNGRNQYNHNPQSIAAYAEAVFRRQNHATSQLMMLSLEDVEDSETIDALLNAEKSMQTACETLNQYAEQSQEATSTSLLLRARAGKSVVNCDHATQILERLLEDLDIAAIESKVSPK